MQSNKWFLLYNEEKIILGIRVLNVKIPKYFEIKFHFFFVIYFKYMIFVVLNVVWKLLDLIGEATMQ